MLHRSTASFRRFQITEIPTQYPTKMNTTRLQEIKELAEKYKRLSAQVVEKQKQIEETSDQSLLILLNIMWDCLIPASTTINERSIGCESFDIIFHHDPAANPEVAKSVSLLNTVDGKWCRLVECSVDQVFSNMRGLSLLSRHRRTELFQAAKDMLETSIQHREKILKQFEEQQEG